MSSVSEPNQQGDGLEAAVEQAIATCDGNTRAAVRALIVANNFLESEIAELKKAVSLTHADAFGPIPDKCQGVVICR
jgi:hypothetical protein